MHALSDAPRWTAAMWAEWIADQTDQTDCDWKVRPDGAGEAEVEWIARGVRADDIARWPELADGKWMMIERTDGGLDGSLWYSEPGRRITEDERRAPTAEELSLPPELCDVHQHAADPNTKH